MPSLLEAARELGHPVLPDQNGAREESAGGFALMNQIIRDGRRHNMAKAFLYPVLAQQNITLLTQRACEQGGAAGRAGDRVEVNVGGQNVVIGATREVILSAGGIDTAKILMLSGIGDAGICAATASRWLWMRRRWG